MNIRESSHILVAIITLTIVISFSSILNSQWNLLPIYLFFSFIIIIISIAAKKAIAIHLDADVEHEIQTLQRYGFKPHKKFKKIIPIGFILPIFFTIFSLGFIKFMNILKYETRALNRRAAKRHGYYSFAEMTDWHDSLIGAFGIIAILILSTVSYFLPFHGAETLSKLSSYYAFWNMIPLLKSDGAQIFIGSRTLYIILATITLIYSSYALFLP